MARLGRARPQPPAIVRARQPIHATVQLGPWETPSEWPALTVLTPNASVHLPAWETASEWPDLSIAVSTTIQLPAWETASEWPALSVTTPVLPGDSMDGRPGQIEYNGFLIGRGTPYQWVTLQGWSEDPDIVSQNVPDPSGHGSLPVRPILGERVILLTGRIRAARDQVEQARDDIKRALALPRDETELPLVINELGTPRLAYGRARCVPGPLDKYTRLGHIPLVVQWTCADPRLYNLDRTGLNLVIDVPTEAPNAGTSDTFPLIRIPGPVTNPVVTNTTTNRTLAFDITLAEGERLIIDPHPHRKSIFLDDGSGTPVLALDALVITESVPLVAFTLQDGDNTLLYTADSGGSAPATVLYRDAWM